VTSRLSARAAGALALTLLIALAGAAGSIPRHTEETAAPQPSEIGATEAQMLRAHPVASRVIRAIATDFDRDGDLDLLASTEDSPLVVLVNDGRGHLTVQPPARVPPVTAVSAVLQQAPVEFPQATPPSPKRLHPAVVVVGRATSADASVPAELGDRSDISRIPCAACEARAPPARSSC